MCRGAVTHTVETDMHLLREDLRAAETSIAAERSRASSLQREVDRTQEMLATATYRAASSESKLRSLQSTHEAEVAALKSQLQVNP